MNASTLFSNGELISADPITPEVHEYRDVHPMILVGFIEDKLKEINLQRGIPPLRQDFNTIALLTEGTCQYHIGLHTYFLKPNDLVVIPENYVNYITDLHNNKGFCIQFKTESLIPFVHAHNITDTFPFLDIDASYVLSLNKADSGRMEHLFQDLIDAYHTDSPEKDNIVKSYLYVLLLKLKELCGLYFGTNKPALSRAQVITKKYKLLVEKHFLSKKTVHEYAELLCITTKHLDDVLKQTLGKTPGDLIQEMILLEAKVLLQQTDMTITQIAHHLNFDDQSYFSRFFKKHTSQTPVEYRANH